MATTGVVGAIGLVPLSSPYGIVEVDGKNYIKKFREKPRLSDYWINSGIYCFTPEIFQYLPDKGNIETVTFPEVAALNKLRAVKFSECFWRSIDSIKDIETVGEELRKHEMDY